MNDQAKPSQSKQYILVVEDDDELAKLIQEYLDAAEFTVNIESQGHNAAQRILDENPDLIVLDLMLPGKDGISICREIRPFYHGPVLMLTASNESVDQIVGLEVGADDYVQKPIEPRILLARIRALLRRTDNQKAHTTETATSNPIKIKNVLLNPEARQVKVNNESIDLTTPEYDVLEFLIKNKGNILSRDDIFKMLRGIEYDGQNRLVDITVSQIRSKLACDGESHRHIKTIRSKGYIFVESFE